MQLKLEPRSKFLQSSVSISQADHPVDGGEISDEEDGGADPGDPTSAPEDWWIPWSWKRDREHMTPLILDLAWYSFWGSRTIKRKVLGGCEREFPLLHCGKVSSLDL